MLKQRWVLCETPGPGKRWTRERKSPSDVLKFMEDYARTKNWAYASDYEAYVDYIVIHLAREVDDSTSPSPTTTSV